MESQIKMVTLHGEGNHAEDLTRVTPHRSQKNGLKKLKEGCCSKGNPGDLPLETKEECTSVLTVDLSASIQQSSNVRRSDKRPLVSSYGRKYHYLYELNIADSTEDHVESHSSEESLQQSSSCDEQERKVKGKSKLEPSESSLDGKQRNTIEEKFYISPEHENILSCIKSLKRNQRIQSKRSLHGCPHCRKCFNEQEQLTIHEEECLAKKKQEYLKSDGTLTSQKPVMRDQGLDLGRGPYESPWCGKHFRIKGNMERHQMTRIRDRRFKCLECGKSFAQRNNVKAHQRTHTGEKPYKCPECGKSFTRKQHVKIHQRSHTGEKPYKCPECEKCFPAHGSLKRHQRSHTGEKPYKCPACGKCFPAKGSLKRHQRSHTGEKPYKCPACGKCFPAQGCLKRHQRSHTGEKPYKCPECGKTFKQSRSLRHHQRIHVQVRSTLDLHV